MLACGGGGGGTSMVTVEEAGVFKPRVSVQVALIVMGPAGAPFVFKVAVFPLPEIVPPLAVQLLTFTSTLSALLHSQVIVAGVPA